MPYTSIELELNELIAQKDQYVSELAIISDYNTRIKRIETNYQSGGDVPVLKEIKDQVGLIVETNQPYVDDWIGRQALIEEILAYVGYNLFQLLDFSLKKGGVMPISDFLKKESRRIKIEIQDLEEQIIAKEKELTQAVYVAAGVKNPYT